MWGAWCKTLVGGFSLGEWEPLCPRPTLPEAACNTAGGLGGAVSPPAGSGRERILAIMYIKFASNNVPGKISVQKKNPLWGAPNCGGPGAAAPFAPLLIRHWLEYVRSNGRRLHCILRKLLDDVNDCVFNHSSRVLLTHNSPRSWVTCCTAGSRTDLVVGWRAYKRLATDQVNVLKPFLLRLQETQTKVTAAIFLRICGLLFTT